jgi:aromatic-L-amino-acid/L-tryptophan decarboxylase
LYTFQKQPPPFRVYTQSRVCYNVACKKILYAGEMLEKRRKKGMGPSTGFIGRDTYRRRIVDAAFAGTALILPEFRWMIRGIEQVDSIVFNPHKWMFTNFDCSLYYAKDRTALLNTFSILPEYLRTANMGKVNDYCDWGIPLGRRFRAFKLWFVIRNFGVEGLKEKLRNHLRLAANFKNWLQEDGRFEIMAPLSLNLVCFRYNPGNFTEEKLNTINEDLLARINYTGKLYLSHTKLNGKYTIRMVIAQTYVQAEHVSKAWEVIKESLE